MNQNVSNHGSGSNTARGALVDHYRTMCRIRAFEEAAVRALKDGHVHGPIHPSIGQEACASGICGPLETDDVLLSTHRGHGHTLVKGADPLAMMRELLGREGGCCRGKGGSMHIADFGVGMLGANGVVGANILIAAGAAHAVKLKGGPQVVVCIFGDGAVNRGPFLEGLNWAKVYSLPVLFVCEDNAYAATTHTTTMTAGEGAAARARGLGLDATEVDGNDVLAVERETVKLVERLRRGEGPAFLHARTFRLTGHTGADPDAYRDQEMVRSRWSDDPIARAAGELVSAGTLTQEETQQIQAAAEREMAGVLEDALDTAVPAEAIAFEDVHALVAGPAAALPG